MLLAQAFALKERGDWAGARVRIQRVLARHPGFVPALHLKALVEHDAGAKGDAIELMERVVKRAPEDLQAWLNLGNMCDEAGRVGRAEACFRHVLALEPSVVPARGSLAVLLERAGRLEEAETELRALLKVAPGEPTALALLAKTLRRLARYEAEVQVAKELLAHRPQDASLRRALSRAYFLWFDQVDREPAKAKAVLEEWIAFDSADPIAVHMRAALLGDAVPERASDAYVERHFDEFSATFDSVLSTLEYRGPEHCCELFAEVGGAPNKALAIVDLGCGTGRCGPLFAPWASSLVGVDLASKMLDEAAKLGVYSTLERGEIVGWLAAETRPFDVAVCADTLIYFGALGPLLSAVAERLAPGGRFVATIELDAEATSTSFRLQPSGRYAHHLAYLEASLAGAGLILERHREIQLRVEYRAPVRGLVFVAQRPARVDAHLP